MKKQTIKAFVENNRKDGNLVFLKIEPVPHSCCCSHCLPELWGNINSEISPQGPIGHEASEIFVLNDEPMVLEQHESGPELLVFINALTTLYNFVKFLFSLSIDSFRKRGAVKVKITKRVITTKQKIVDESIKEIELSNSKKEIIDKLKEIIKITKSL
jgi:hypothetical protein